MPDLSAIPTGRPGLLPVAAKSGLPVAAPDALAGFLAVLLPDRADLGTGPNGPGQNGSDAMAPDDALPHDPPTAALELGAAIHLPLADLSAPFAPLATVPDWAAPQPVPESPAVAQGVAPPFPFQPMPQGPSPMGDPTVPLAVVDLSKMPPALGAADGPVPAAPDPVQAQLGLTPANAPFPAGFDADRPWSLGSGMALASEVATAPTAPRIGLESALPAPPVGMNPASPVPLAGLPRPSADRAPPLADVLHVPLPSGPIAAPPLPVAAPLTAIPPMVIALPNPAPGKEQALPPSGSMTLTVLSPPQPVDRATLPSLPPVAPPLQARDGQVATPVPQPQPQPQSMAAPQTPTPVAPVPPAPAPHALAQSGPALPMPMSPAPAPSSPALPALADPPAPAPPVAPAQPATLASLPPAPAPAPVIAGSNPAAPLAPVLHPGRALDDAVAPPVPIPPAKAPSLDPVAPIASPPNAPRPVLGTGAGDSRPLPPGDPVQFSAPDLARPDIPPRLEGPLPHRLPDAVQASVPQGQQPLAASAAAQILRAVQEDLGRPTGAPIDIALDPPELGRVRLSMVEVNGVLSLSISVERPETADLMRRHLVLLADEFLRAGVDAPAVQISHQGGQGGQGAGGGHASAAPALGVPPTGADADDPTAPMPARRALSHGLDLRL